MRKHLLTIATACLAVFLLAGEAAARPPMGGGTMGGPGGEAHGRFLDRYAERLGIDADTRKQMDAIFEASRAEAKPLEEKLRAGHQEMRDLLNEEAPDPDAVMAKVEELGALRTQLSKLRLTTLLKTRALLTPEQRAQMMAIHEERKSARLEPLLDACGDEVESYCSDVAPDDPPALLRCLHGQREGLSDQCRDALRRGPGRCPHGQGPPPDGVGGPPDF